VMSRQKQKGQTMTTSTQPARWRVWAPFQELGRLQNDLEEILEFSGLGRPFLGQRERRFPLMNVIVSDLESVLFAELPGVELKDVDITLSGTTLTLKGERKLEADVPEEKYFRRERSAGPFGRTVELPHKVDVDKIEASLKDGVLRIRLPHAAEVQPRRITVKG